MNTRTRLRLTALVFGLSLFGAFALAQPKAAPAKPAAATPKQASDAPCCEACGKGECPMKAGGECPMHGGAGECPMHGGAGECPMHAGAKAGGCKCPLMGVGAIASTKVENTKQGASLVFTAKNAADTQKVQALLQEVAKHIAEDGGCCAMKHGAGPGPHGPAHAH